MHLHVVGAVAGLGDGGRLGAEAVDGVPVEGGVVCGPGVAPAGVVVAEVHVEGAEDVVALGHEVQVEVVAGVPAELDVEALGRQARDDDGVGGGVPHAGVVHHGELEDVLAGEVGEELGARGGGVGQLGGGAGRAGDHGPLDGGDVEAGGVVGGGAFELHDIEGPNLGVDAGVGDGLVGVGRWGGAGGERGAGVFDIGLGLDLALQGMLDAAGGEQGREQGEDGTHGRLLTRTV